MMEDHPGRSSVRRLARSRVLAWLVDWACTLGWLAALTLLGVMLRSTTWQLDPVVWQVVIAAGTVAPVTLWLTGWEARGATPGKRLLGLAVTTATGGPVGFGRALLRNLLKVAVLWQLGHLIFAYFMLHPDAETLPGLLIAAMAVVYPLMLWYVIALFVGSGRTPYDLVAGTRVAPAGGPARQLPV